MLFDNQDDPLQQHNRVNSAAMAEVQQQLEEQLAAMLAERGDAFEPPADLRKRWGYRINDAEEIPYRW